MMGSASIKGLMRRYVHLEHGYPELFLKLPSKWCILKGALTYSLLYRGGKQMPNYKVVAFKHVYCKK